MSDAAKPARAIRLTNGTIFVLVLVACGIIGWLLYQPYLPKTWLHDFAGEIAARAAADPTPPEPEDTRQVQKRETPDHPFICATDVVRVPWDKMVIVTAAQDLAAHPVLADADWGRLSRESTATQLRSDKRYQMIVLLKDGKVTDAQLFFTFWGDLGAIARPEGFTRAQAAFTAYSNDGVYFVEPAADVPPGVCATP